MFPMGAYPGVVVAQYGTALVLDLGNELGKGLLDVLLAAVMIQMIVFHVGHHSDVGMEFQEGAIAFIGFCHHIVAFPVAGVGAQVVHDAPTTMVESMPQS
jgi:hypothetical protein